MITYLVDSFSLSSGYSVFHRRVHVWLGKTL